jgi:hypothetical protein
LLAFFVVNSRQSGETLEAVRNTPRAITLAKSLSRHAASHPVLDGFLCLHRIGLFQYPLSQAPFSS